VVRFRALGLQPSETIHLQDPCPLGPQEAGKPCTEGAGAFYPDAIQGEGDVEVLVGIHAQSEPYGTCGDASPHVFFLPSIGE
jgi:hypothetical protein